MAYDTWDWSSVTGSGKIGKFSPKRRDPVNRNDTDAGYRSTAPQDVRGWWIHRISFNLLRPSSYIYLMDFFHDHRGGLPFYFTWPFGMAGIPDEAMLAVPGGMAPWDSEITPGAGEGPTNLVFWDADEFGVERIGGPENYWTVDGTIELRQT